MENMITYEMLIENELTDGVFSISLVDKPAIEIDYVLLSEEKNIQIDLKLEKLLDNKRKIVCGPVLRPGLVIPRQGYNIVFSEDTIRKISENFLIDGYKDSSTLQHKLPVNKVRLIESWIVEDSEKDKSVALGFKNIEKGTWFVSLKIVDDNLWNEYIESGILKGFSIEGHFTEKEVKLEHKHNCSCGCDHNLELEDLDEFTSDWSDEDKDIYDIYTMLAKPNNAKARTDNDDPSIYTLNDLDLLYVWKVNPGTNGDCPICLRNNNKVFKLRQWSRIGIPRIANDVELGKTGVYTNYSRSPGPFATYCETNCNCKLVKIPERAQPDNKTGKPTVPSIWKSIWKNILPPKVKTNPNYDPTKSITSKNQPFI